MKPGPLKICSNQTGQAITEYILMILVALSLVIAVSTGLKKVLFRLWMQMACDVTAACPHCPPPPEVKSIANKVSPGSCK